MSQDVGMSALEKAFKDGGDFYNPAPGEYTFKIVGEGKSKSALNATMFLEVQGGPDAGQKWLTTFGSLNGNGAGMATRQWNAVGVTMDWIKSLGTDDYATIVAAVRTALIGVVIQAKVEPQGGTGQYADRPNLVFGSIKLVSRPELPPAAQALSGASVPAVPTAVPTAPPVPTATAPASVPAAAPAPSAAPAVAPAGPTQAELEAQIAALQAQAAATAAAQPQNGVVTGAPAAPAPAPAIATDEDPGF